MNSHDKGSVGFHGPGFFPYGPTVFPKSHLIHSEHAFGVEATLRFPVLQSRKLHKLSFREGKKQSQDWRARGWLCPEDADQHVLCSPGPEVSGDWKKSLPSMLHLVTPHLRALIPGRRPHLHSPNMREQRQGDGLLSCSSC